MSKVAFYELSIQFIKFFDKPHHYAFYWYLVIFRMQEELDNEL